jgi:hypothetical protein
LLEPFKIAIPDDVLRDLSRRLGAVRLGSVEKAGWEEGTDPAYLSELIDYWRIGYDWRRHEAKLNDFRHLRGTVDGVTLHLIHEKRSRPRAPATYSDARSDARLSRFLLPLLQADTFAH